MKQWKNSMLIISMVLASVLLSCTKEKPYEFVANKQIIPKSALSKEDFGNLSRDQISKLTPEEKRQYRTPRIAVMSYGQATRTATASMPYFQGRTKLVEYEISEHSIEVRELENDPRFVDNPTNSKTIMVLPIRHVDYDCERDAYGECQNKEIEDEKKHWKDRKYIEIDFENTKMLDADQLPVEITNLFSGCYSEGNQKLIDTEITKDVFNFELQKSYSINLSDPSCWSEIADFENFFEKLNFDVRYVYSMVRDDLLASANYEKIEYKKEDENTFGFFTSEVEKLDVDNNPIENNDDVFLNRWNPKKKVITYYLSDEFNKPEYDYILAATQTAVQNINNGLAQSGAGLQIQLLAPAGKKVGDLRHNMIVLVDDPLASRIIGYGPSVAHPLTGEIVNARTVMYLGTIKGIVKRTYEDMREELLAKKNNDSLNGGVAAVNNLRQYLQGLTAPANGRNMLSAALHANLSAVNLADKTDVLLAKVQMNKQDEDLVEFSNATLSRIKEDVSKFRKLEAASLHAVPSKFIDKRIDTLSKHNIYPEELFNAHWALESAGIKEKIKNEMKPWDQLTGREKEQIIRTVLPHIWIPTLVHELGHNLGLRHNFAGSEDKENFYSEDELKNMGIDHEVPYASMMEYSYKTTNELPTLGKYDIAALKFAYKREVDVVNKDGVVKTIKVQKNLNETTKEIASQGLALRPYRFCTDEHASANPTCNRFDEGTNLIEIATHFITSYETNYKRINRRNSRKNFSLFQEGAYLRRIANNFYDLRLTYELYERIKNDYGIHDGHEMWKQGVLKEIYEASRLSGQFFLSLLLTPDLNCAIALAQEPRVPVALFKIRDLDPYATTCFHEDVQRTVDLIGKQNGLELMVVGEGGKSFKSRKDPLNQNSYADQIDVQGIWIDKMLALEFLFARELGTNLFDSHVENFLDHATVSTHIEKVLTAVLLGRGGIQVPFRDAEGYEAKFVGEGGAITNVLPVTLEFGPEHRINVPLIAGLSDYFGLPNEQTTFQKALLGTIERLVPTQVESVAAQRFLDTFSIHRSIPDGQNISDYVAVRIGDSHYYASEKNKVALAAMKALEPSRILQGLTVTEVKKLLEMKKNNEVLPADASEQIKKAYSLTEEILQAYIDGLIKDPALYAELLISLIAK